MRDSRGDEGAGQLGGGLVRLGLGQVALENRVGGALAELGLEDRGEGQPSARPKGPDAVRAPISLRHRRP